MGRSRVSPKLPLRRDVNLPRDWDGIVSRHFNRKLSRPVAKFLAEHTAATPNQMTVLSFLVGFSSGILFYLNHCILGGLLAQAGSVLDGVDGDLAVFKKRTSKFGGFLDSILDRYADIAIIMGMLYKFIVEGTFIGVFFGLAALFGSLMVSYSRARVYRGVVFKGFSGYAANRDVRLFIIMFGGLLNQVFYALILLAFLTNLVVVKRLYDLSRLRGG